MQWYLDKKTEGQKEKSETKKRMTCEDRDWSNTQASWLELLEAGRSKERISPVPSEGTVACRHFSFGFLASRTERN